MQLNILTDFSETLFLYNIDTVVELILLRLLCRLVLDWMNAEEFLTTPSRELNN